MNYFMSDIRGASKEYFEMKNRIGFKNNDELYIMGDILDGNSKHPECCLEILDDVMRHNNIHLVLGDHEYAYIMYYMSKQNEAFQNEWQDIICGPDFNGAPLLNHLGSLSEKEQSRYISYLISRDMSELVKIGSKYFYLVHGAPAVCKQGDVYTWQQEVVNAKLSLKYNYFLAVASDPGLQMPPNLTKDDLVIIAGQTPTESLFRANEDLLKKYYKDAEGTKTQKIIYENKKMLIDCGCKADTLNYEFYGWAPNLACVGIDAAGYFVEYLNEVN